ncbi:MAG: TrmB family transcriptional regulator [Deltaproteobacteria bacterium]|nr:TrmB family transcriptional regulator [Deltaproteobacteria bacterium]
MAEPDLVSALVELGFSLNESRAYHALLRESPATGYEVAARARIPRSAVYGVLRRLVAAGAARSIAGTPERFVAAPAEELLTILRKRFDSSTGTFERALRELDTSPPVPDAYSVRGYKRILEEAERLVSGSSSRLVLSGWPREMLILLPELKAASRRGVFLVAFSHAALPTMPGQVFSYGLDEARLEKFWKHRLVVVADDTRTLIGATESGDHDQAVVSEMAPIAEVATSQIALDITLLSQRTGRDVQPVMERMLGDRVGSLDELLGQEPEKPAPRRRGRA